MQQMQAVGKSKIISIHALRVEGDRRPAPAALHSPYFYPRPPGGGRQNQKQKMEVKKYFYPRPPGGGRPGAVDLANEAWTISIHALRVEGDPDRQQPGGQKTISIHALRVEGDLESRLQLTERKLFLSTPSGWRATYQGIIRILLTMNFYPRPPGGGRLKGGGWLGWVRFDFYPRPPGGGRRKKTDVHAR